MSIGTGKRKVGRIVNVRQQKEKLNLKEKSKLDIRKLIHRVLYWHR